MPVQMTTNADGDEVEHYVVPFAVRTSEWSSEDLDVVRENRRGYGRHVEFLASLQKQFSKERDIEGGRAIREHVKTAQQWDRSATLVINYFERNTTLSTKDYPVELAEYLDYEFNCIEMAWLERNAK